MTNKYTYNYKELNEDFGLNWHDYGARWYDAALGRWWSVDPMAEPQANYSPYAYTYNNPLSFIDPTGMMGESADGMSNDQWLDRTRKDGGYWERAKEYMKININRAIQDLNGNTRFIGDDDLDEDAQVTPYGTRVYIRGKLKSDWIEGYYIQKGNYGRRQSEAPEVCVPCLVVIIAALITAPEVATNGTGNYKEDAAVIQEAQSMKNEWLLAGLTAPVRAEGYAISKVGTTLMAKQGRSTPGGYKLLDGNYLKKLGHDAHAIKRAWLGEKAPIAKYDLYITEAREIIILLKGGKGTPVHTGIEIPQP